MNHDWVKSGLDPTLSWCTNCGINRSEFTPRAGEYGLGFYYLGRPTPPSVTYDQEPPCHTEGT